MCHYKRLNGIVIIKTTVIMKTQPNFMARTKAKYTEHEFKLRILQILVFTLLGIITFRLFYLQVIQHGYYTSVAAKEHFGYTELPARRGEIFIQDYASGETVRVATNITLDTLFADPTIIENKKLVADRITPIIFDLEAEKLKDERRVEQELKRAKTLEEEEKIKTLSDEELYTQFYNNLLEKISQDVRPEIQLTNTIDENLAKKISNLGLTGVEVNNNIVYAYPPQITDRTETASVLSQYIDITATRLEQILQGKNRYVILATKIPPEKSAEIRQIQEEDTEKNYFGLGLEENYYRYYPEKELSANVLGYVTKEGIGTYGIESKYNTRLQGKKGVFQTQRDGSIHGRQITVGDSVIEPAVDGDDIVLTIDRSIQMTVEKLLAKAVKDYRADSGQVIVMDPKTGRIMAMAHYPTFDPNDFSAALEMEEISFTPQEVEQLVPLEGEGYENQFWFYRNVSAHDRFKVFRQLIDPEDPDAGYIYKRYKNWIGLEAYRNLAASGAYEPGSVFKVITMASALDDNDVTPTTYINDSGILEVDEFKISNVSAKCTGRVNMTQVLAYSCNTGVGWVAQQMGRNLFYSYMVKFGFGERTGIEFDNEHPGKIEHFNQWAESELVTYGFGQGFTATPIQMVAAFGAIANDGLLMQPYIVDKISQKNDKIIETHPAPINQVISEDTTNLVTSMMVAATETGVSGNAKTENHYVAAKTGTSQTYKYGKPLKGAGTTIASVAGFGPIDDPKFVLYAKLDRPRTSEWADSTTSHLFSDVATYLYDYLGIPPDKN
ncbi:hypothetical protein GF340_04715 [Candidatus Peregrinibacteria bacterium]|nr:hypothetical protein [Candidatus Peregrinibacteria bacterium]